MPFESTTLTSLPAFALRHSYASPSLLRSSEATSPVSERPNMIYCASLCIVSDLEVPYPGNILKAGIWINVECNIGIVCSNLPLLRPVINAAFPPSFRSKLSFSRSGFSYSSRRKRASSYRMSDANDKFASMGTGNTDSKNAKETVRAKIESVPKRTYNNWFSRHDSFDEDEEMVPVSGRR